MIEVLEIQKDKKHQIACEMTIRKSIYSFTNENVLEIIEWIHNLRKYTVFRMKFGSRLPIYDDKLNTCRENILDIEKLINNHVKCGYVTGEARFLGSTSKWIELTLEYF